MNFLSSLALFDSSHEAYEEGGSDSFGHSLFHKCSGIFAETALTFSVS